MGGASVIGPASPDDVLPASTSTPRHRRILPFLLSSHLTKTFNDKVEVYLVDSSLKIM